MRLSGLLFSLCALVALNLACSPASAESVADGHIVLGHSTIPLNGPWRFHVGDDRRWSSIDFDDSAWETVDLTPAAGSHDGDVGLPGYVPGWNRRGHAGYAGYAWYRIKVTVESDTNVPFALAGPTLVDSTYQLYVDGKLLGETGMFSGATPKVFGVRPQVFPLPSSSSPGPQTYLIAFRVWMDPIDAGEDSGGIHVAPTIGDAEGIERLHQVQWLQTFKGYVVDAAEPITFVVLALMVVALIACRTDDAYRWLVAALLLLALLRIQQVLFYWTDMVSLRGYYIVTAVILKPLNLAAWTLAWRDWFGLRRAPWLRYAIGALTVLYVLAACIGLPWLSPPTSALKATTTIVTEGVRLIYAAIYLGIVGRGVSRSIKLSVIVAALAAILVGVGLFATELSALGIPGIWFPYGTGVARGQYAYAAFIALLFALILMRSTGYARRK
jgi:hypothetical protein